MFAVIFVPAFVSLIFGYYLMLQFVPLRFQWTLSKTRSMACKIFNMIFISQLSIGVVPFVCYSSPNGKMSVSAFPSITCFEAEEVRSYLASHHFGMVILAIFSLVLATTFFAYLCFEV